jgi:hypothetical protein
METYTSKSFVEMLQDDFGLEVFERHSTQARNQRTVIQRLIKDSDAPYSPAVRGSKASYNDLTLLKLLAATNFRLYLIHHLSPISRFGLDIFASQMPFILDAIDWQAKVDVLSGVPTDDDSWMYWDPTLVYQLPERFRRADWLEMADEFFTPNSDDEQLAMDFEEENNLREQEYKAIYGTPNYVSLRQIQQKLQRDFGLISFGNFEDLSETDTFDARTNETQRKTIQYYIRRYTRVGTMTPTGAAAKYPAIALPELLNSAGFLSFLVKNLQPKSGRTTFVNAFGEMQNLRKFANTFGSVNATLGGHPENVTALPDFMISELNALPAFYSTDVIEAARKLI